jgi:hypothetical protein
MKEPKKKQPIPPRRDSQQAPSGWSQPENSPDTPEAARHAQQTWACTITGLVGLTTERRN